MKDYKMYYNSRLTKYARNLRKNKTKSETWLWELVLRRKQMKGYTFRRQRPVGNYIVDFLCKELKLIVELDGLTHRYYDVSIKDEIRQKELERLGFTVMRFDDEVVLNDLDEVVRTIELWIEEEDRK